MRRLYTALAIALVLSTSLVAGLAVVPAEAAPATSISVNQNGNYAALSVSAGPKDQVRWDFDDGSFGSGPSTGHTWAPGLYNVRAVIIPASGDPYVLSKHVGVYSPGPVTEIVRNEEYRYAVYNGPSPKLTVTDSQGRVVSWLTYDPTHRIVTGVPRDVGTYHATLTGDRTITWTIAVIDGPLQAPWVRFSAHAVNGTVVMDSLYGSSNDAATRYTWTLQGSGRLHGRNKRGQDAGHQGGSGSVPALPHSPGSQRFGLLRSTDRDGRARSRRRRMTMRSTSACPG